MDRPKTTYFGQSAVIGIQFLALFVWFPSLTHETTLSFRLCPLPRGLFKSQSKLCAGVSSSFAFTEIETSTTSNVTFKNNFPLGFCHKDNLLKPVFQQNMQGKRRVQAAIL